MGCEGGQRHDAGSADEFTRALGRLNWHLACMARELPSSLTSESSSLAIGDYNSGSPASPSSPWGQGEDIFGPPPRGLGRVLRN